LREIGADKKPWREDRQSRALGENIQEECKQEKHPKKGTREEVEWCNEERIQASLREREWKLLEPLIPPAKPGGHPRTTDMREVINAILYLDRTGGQWRALAHEFPPWSTVWSYFRSFRNDGTCKRIHTALREQTRIKQGREPTPSAAIIESQSVKSSHKGGGAVRP
jgi:transposase